MDLASASTVNNAAPWLMTVAATGLDRRLMTLVKLGNGKKIYVSVSYLSHI